MKYLQTVKKVLAQDVKIPEPSNPTELDLEDALAWVETVIDIALNLATIVGVIMILYSALLYVSSFGDDSKAELAKKTLLWSIIGTAVVAIARVVVYLTKNALS